MGWAIACWLWGALMPWSRQGLEDSAIALLDPLKEAPFGFKVMAWPDREIQVAATDRMILAAIVDESWEPPLHNDSIDQVGQLALQIQTIVRSRRGPGGQLRLRDAITRLLTRDIEGAGRCYLQDAGLIARDGPCWRFSMQFAIEVNLSEMEF